MGKGGQQPTTSSEPRQRSSLSKTIPQPYSEITKRSLRESIPKAHFEHSYVKSLGYLLWDLVEVALAGMFVHHASQSAPAALQPFIWLSYWMYQGITFTGLWVIAHECGHGGFTASRIVNDSVGFILHSSLMTPYFSWAFTHAKHHHYTNHMTMGETWVPSTASKDKPSVKFAKSTFGTARRIIVVFFIGWYTYLITNETGAKSNKGQSHFNPGSKALFKAKDRPYVILSNLGMMIAGSIILYSMSQLGFLPVVFYYGIPQTIANFYLAAITFMQHTHEDVPHFEAEQWTWLRGALSTIDRSMGSFVDHKLHHIVDSHVVHHIFSDMPFYGAKAATPYVKKHLGEFYKNVPDNPVLGSQYLGYWRDYYSCMRKAVSVGKGEDNFLWFH